MGIVCSTPVATSNSPTCGIAEQTRPVCKGSVRRHQCGGLFVAAHQHIGQFVARLRGEFAQEKIVDEQEIGRLELLPIRAQVADPVALQRLLRRDQTRGRRLYGVPRSRAACLCIRAVLVEPGVTRTAFEENLTRADQPLPAYAAERARSERLMRKWVEAGDPPQVVADAVVKAATASTPKLRYAADKQSGQVRSLRRFMPEGVVDSILRKFNELPAQRAAGAVAST